MSYIDNEIQRFFDHKVSLSWAIDDYTKWMQDYKSKRNKYPDWITKDGIHIKVCDISDQHLNNLIPFVEKRDPENKTHWVDVFKAEKRYRALLTEQLKHLKIEYAEMERVAELCF